MNNYYDDMTNLYQVTKTLQFALKPVSATQQYLSVHNIKESDAERHDTAKECQRILDGFYRFFISTVLKESALSELTVDWDNLALLWEAASSKSVSAEEKRKATQQFAEAKAEAMNSIIEHIKNHAGNLNNIEPAKIIDAAVASNTYYGYSFSDHDRILLKTFKGFTGVFVKFKENRNYIFSGKTSNTIAYRIVNDNFGKHAENISIYRSLPAELKTFMKETLRRTLNEDCEEFFTPSTFTAFINEDGIERYNRALGGQTLENGTKLQGMNEILNEAYQRGMIGRKTQFRALYKQILSERSTYSFVDEEGFADDRAVLLAVGQYADQLQDHLKTRLPELLNVWNQTEDQSRVFVLPNTINKLSALLYGESKWYMIEEQLGKPGKLPIAVADLNRRLHLEEDQCIIPTVASALTSKTEHLGEELEALQEQLDGDRIGNAFLIKRYLDCVKDIYYTAMLFNTVVKDNKSGELKETCIDKDSAFYDTLEAFCEPFIAGNILYSRIQKYATKKEYSTEKYALTFNNPTLGNGWDKNKEADYRCIILRFGEKYYLGIYNKDCKKLMSESEEYLENAYEKMVYKQMRGASLYFGKIFGAKKPSVTKPIPEDIKKLAGKAKDLKSKNLATLIDYIIHELIPNSPLLHKKNGEPYFNFRFKKPADYNTWQEFCDDFDRQNYAVYWAYVDQEQINSFVNEGSLYLFEIYNKDFASKAHGNKDLYTLYFEQLFSKENLVDPVFKLNGGAEFFFRPASIKEPFVHKEGSVLFNKRYKDGTALPTEIISQLNMDIESAEDISILSKKYPDVVFKISKYDIVKNRRYTQDQYSIHFPITINKAAPAPRAVKISPVILQKLAKDKSINIIGIDRGERNLIYATVIDQNGRILEQRSLNVINGFDYHDKLATIEKDRIYARQTWSGIGKIADYKKGYLSLAVNEICRMVLQYNAVVVMENLNAGFKRVRSGISEKAVYKEFENSLVKKLNYLLLKEDIEHTGYQLTDPFTTVDDLNKAVQSGIVFYIPAAYTSQIDPTTGFVNLFTRNELEYENRDKATSFFRTFDNIGYNEKRSCFEFSFTYSQFNLKNVDPTDSWTVSTVGEERIAKHKNDAGIFENSVINVTEKLHELFDKYEVPVGAEMINDICSVDKAEFYKELLYLLRLTLQLRYSDSEKDYILSPIVVDGKWFDSRNAAKQEPVDADANGAYHIALEGLRTIKRIDTQKWQIAKEDKARLTNYLRFCQSR